MSTPKKSIEEQSVKSLYLETFFDNQLLGSGTGFVVESKVGPMLITNWHIVAGRNPETKDLLSPSGGIPNNIRILHNKKNSLGTWIFKKENLYSNDKPLWYEHSLHNEKVDVVALRLTDLNDVDIFLYILDENDPKISIRPAETVSVVGFPFSLGSIGPARQSGLALWTTGFIASEIQFDYGDLPRFVIDCRTRKGQSGSRLLLLGLVPLLWKVGVQWSEELNAGF